MNENQIRQTRRNEQSQQSGTFANGSNPSSDPWSFPLAVARHWAWIILATVVAGILGSQVWSSYWSDRYVATAQLIRAESPENYLAPVRQVAGTTLNEIINSTEVHARVGSRLRPLLSAREVSKIVRIEPSRNNDLINVVVSLPDRDKAIEITNTYVEEAASMTRQMQVDEAMDASQYLEMQLSMVRKEIASVQAALTSQPELAFQGQQGAPSRSLVLFKRLEDAGDELLFLLGRYTDAHPLVQEQRARVAMLEQQISILGTKEVSGDDDEALGTTEDSVHGTEGLVEGLLALEAQRVLITGRMRVTQVIAENPPGLFRVFAHASERDVEVSSSLPMVAFATLASSMLGLVLMAGFFMIVELFDRRMKSPADIQRVTQLPVLAVLGTKRWKRPQARSEWAFRTWAALQNNVSATPNAGLICGFTSSRPKEGRTLWVTALADAANQCGFRVLTITTQHTARKNGIKSVIDPKDGKDRKGNEKESKSAKEEIAVNSSEMHSPAEITRKVADPDHPPVVHIPLPGWVWNLERRKEWFAALDEWRSIENLVILIELPPASTPETVLLAQNLPNLVWLVDSRRAEAPETQRQLKTLRNARCNLVGAVVNHAPNAFNVDRFARWRSATAAILCLIGVLFHASPMLDAEPMSESSGANPASAHMSVVSPDQRADWQRELKLGPGDVLQLSLIGAPELTRDAIVIQPDGHIGFLEVHGIQATGLSVDELRLKLDEALGEFRRSPRTMVVPVAYQSKKYYMLGRVAETGTYTLERPITIVEAVARAQGFQTGMTGQNHAEMVDLSRSFLVRNGEVVHVNFKELFSAGNLEHNISIEPNDYFYFPPARPQEVYMLGAFETQGAVEFSEGLSVVRAVATRGGLTRRAWRQNILLVRGSLDSPETFRVSMADVLAGRERDVPLEAGDIIYVSERPWIRAEQLLDDVISAFAQTVTIYWTTDNILSR